MNKTSLYLLFLTFCCACKKETDNFDPPSNSILLNNMAVGQRNYYRHLGGDGPTNPYNYDYQPDTLLLEVVAEEAGVFTLKESLTPGSLALSKPEQALKIPGGINPSMYRLTVKDGQLTFVGIVGTGTPRLFYKSQQTWPTTEVTTDEVKFDSWYPPYSPFFSQAYVRNIKVGKYTFQRLNVVCNDKHKPVDVPRRFFLYNPKAGLVRSGQMRGAWDSRHIAWDLIE